MSTKLPTDVNTTHAYSAWEVKQAFEWEGQQYGSDTSVYFVSTPESGIYNALLGNAFTGFTLCSLTDKTMEALARQCNASHVSLGSF